MGESKNYLIHFEPPQELSNKIQYIFNKISSEFDNTYNSLIDGIWRSHLMVYLSPMPVANEPEILKVLELISKELKPFRVVLGDFVKGSNGYIFVEVNNKYQNTLIEIREKIIEALYPLRDTAIKQKYLDKWDQFSSEEKERIKLTGLPYEYNAHFTVAQVPADKQDEALSIIKDRGLSGESFTASELQVLTYHEGINKIIGKYPLRKLKL